MRKTPLVKEVLKLLQDSKKPLSVPEMQTALINQKLTPNKTTLYRILEKLELEGDIEALLLDPKVTYYEFRTYHHHHFRCESCDEIKCISDPELESQIHALESKLQAKGFMIKDHHFSLSGKCDSC